MARFFKAFFGFVSKYRIAQIVIGLCLAVMIVYTVVGVLAARKRIAEMNGLYMPEKRMEGNDDQQVFETRKQNSFDLARLTLAKSDSVSMLIDLVDSLVTLNLKGVTVHKAKIVNYSKSALFDALHPDALVNMMSKPMQVKTYYSSIVKEPRIYKKAPKDTIEAATQELEQDTMVAHLPSFYFLGLDNDIQISFMHEFEKEHSYFPLVKNQKIGQFKAATDSLKKFALPEYLPYINIEMAKSDATTVFRAIPQHAYVAIRF
ncbi:MAG: hypothetical protein QM786_02955 [Breznakibacter sp.]